MAPSGVEVKGEVAQEHAHVLSDARWSWWRAFTASSTAPAAELLGRCEEGAGRARRLFQFP